VTTALTLTLPRERGNRCPVEVDSDVCSVPALLWRNPKAERMQ
jgi:hypothetical protein